MSQGSRKAAGHGQCVEGELSSSLSPSQQSWGGGREIWGGVEWVGGRYAPGVAKAVGWNLRYQEARESAFMFDLRSGGHHCTLDVCNNLWRVHRIF